MFSKEIYQNRRNSLKKLLTGGLILLPGNNDTPMNYSANTFSFRQDSSFLYFFGLDLPGLTGVIDLDSGEDMIFGDDIDLEDIIWTGVLPTLKENASKVGVIKTAENQKLHNYIHNAVKLGRRIHYLPPYRHDVMILIQNLLEIEPATIKLHSSVELIKAVVALRSIKDLFEIEELEKAAKSGYEMHLKAMKICEPGIYEQELVGEIIGIPSKYNGMCSFPIILTQNGETLHNHHHGNLLESGRLLLIDAGSESSLHYASDYTRTIPVGGKFNQKQREIYEIVMKANNNTFELAKPGITYQSIHLQASKIIALGLKDLGLMKGDMDEAVKQGAHAMFFPHGLGHMLGLDVHDMENLGEDYVGYDEETKRIQQFGTAYLRLGKKLQPYFAITNEPGIYFIPALIDKWQSEKKFTEFINYDKVNQYRDFGGIRLEDNLLVTETGCRYIGKRLPITIEEVEMTIKS